MENKALEHIVEVNKGIELTLVILRVIGDFMRKIF